MKESILQIITNLKTRILELDKTDENYLVEQRELLNHISYFKNYFLIGVYKRIEQMPKEELLELAFKNFDEEIVNINSKDFLREYDEIKEYIDGFKEDIEKKKSIVETIDFTVEGRMCVLFNEDGTPKTDIIVPLETQKLIQKQFKLKSYPKAIERKIAAKVSSDYFTTEELYQLGLHKFSSEDYYFPGYVCRRPDDIDDNTNEFYKKFPNVFIGFRPSRSDSKRLTSKYDYYTALNFIKKIEMMNIIYSKIKTKNKLETDLNYLRDYIKSLVLSPDFIKEFNKNTAIQSYGVDTTMLEIYEKSSFDSNDYIDIDRFIQSKINSK